LAASSSSSTKPNTSEFWSLPTQYWNINQKSPQPARQLALCLQLIRHAAPSRFVPPIPRDPPGRVPSRTHFEGLHVPSTVRQLCSTIIPVTCHTPHRNLGQGDDRHNVQHVPRRDGCMAGGCVAGRRLLRPEGWVRGWRELEGVDLPSMTHYKRCPRMARSW